ncbi:hypothetical protein HAL1_09322 [Halomonas sp. HAL1]|nr:hypothetical protein HAL1_09322 [Halomonas sp. HAL1]
MVALFLLGCFIAYRFLMHGELASKLMVSMLQGVQRA